jgi:D-alanine-D-alanine ligase
VKKLRVLVLLQKGLEPPDSIEEMSDDEILSAPWKMEYDIIQTLETLGHDIKILGVHDELAFIQKSIDDWQPHIAFNLLEGFAGEVLYDQNVVTYLELKQLPYTGCNPRGLMISRDKSLSKKLLAYHRIRVPNFAIFPKGRRFRTSRKLRFPLIVKSAIEDASFSISQASLVKDADSLLARVEFIHEQTGSSAIVEEFIEGREIYVGVIGNKRVEVLPPRELVFEKKPNDVPLIATARAKWNIKYQKKWGVKSRPADRLPQKVEEKISRLCKRIYRTLYLNGYARLDFRLDGNNRLYCLEANPNPDLSYGEDFAESAEKKGMSYDQLIQKILNLGLRWRTDSSAAF